MSERISYMEPGVCAECGSDRTTIVRMDKGYNVLLWYECNECGCEFIEAYDYSSKGVPAKEEA